MNAIEKNNLDKVEVKKGTAVRGKKVAGSKTKKTSKALERVRDKKIDKAEQIAQIKADKKAAAVAVKSASGKLTRTQQGHMIQKLLQQGPINVKQIAEKTGLSESRTLDHVEYEISKGRASYDKKGRVVIGDKQPRYRTA